MKTYLITYDLGGSNKPHQIKHNAVNLDEAKDYAYQYRKENHWPAYPTYLRVVA